MAFFPEMRGILRCAVGLALGMSAAVAAAQDVAALRYLSFAIRDQGPTVEEAQAFAAGSVSLDALVGQWLDGDEHAARIARYFNDLFGVRKSLQLSQPHLVLTLDPEGFYYIGVKGRCQLSEAETVSAWWSDDTVQACPSATSSSVGVSVGGRTVTCAAATNQLSLADCGCGPGMILCLPQSLMGELWRSVREEFSERGLEAYRSDRSWGELIGGDYFVANRALYWIYLFLGGVATEPRDPTAAELATLATLPLSGEGVASAFPSGAERAGVVTSPGFMQQFNSYRSRIYGLTTALLCQEVDATLNTAGLDSFYNEDLPELNEASQFSDGDCTPCHYPMENLGSALLGWDSVGRFGVGQQLSQVAHAFGEQGEGPAFLAAAFVERGPGFAQCMATKAWEDLSGVDWEWLSAADQAAILAMASEGPRALLRGILMSTLLRQARNRAAAATTFTGSGPSGGSASGAGVDFASQVAPILARSCDGTSCHSDGAAQTVYVGNEANLRANAAAVASRIRLTGGAAMPPPTSQKVLSSTERDSILEFLGEL